MKVLDPGHRYNLTNLDVDEEAHSAPFQELRFVKRDTPPEMYPGNIGRYSGTTIQEVCRALIDRLQYVYTQVRCDEDILAINHLRRVIDVLETRAAKRHGRMITPRYDIENEPTCKLCGHIQCNETCRQIEQPEEAHV